MNTTYTGVRIRNDDAGYRTELVQLREAQLTEGDVLIKEVDIAGPHVPGRLIVDVNR